MYLWNLYLCIYETCIYVPCIYETCAHNLGHGIKVHLFLRNQDNYLKIFFFFKIFSFLPLPYCLLKFFFSLPPICSHSLPSALPLNSSERYNNKNTVEWRRSRWQSRRMWSSPPPTEHIKNTSACGAILTADKLKTVGKTFIQPALKIHPHGIM